MPYIGAVADDLTGATTTGVLLARSGARTAAFFNEGAVEKNKNTEGYDALIVSSNSRALSRETAYEKVKAATGALKRLGVKWFSKRIDTTLRGGIGVEIDAMLDLLDDAVAVVVPSMPQSRRILVGGYSIIDGVSLIRTPVAQDVRTPVTENYIPRLLETQTRRAVGLVTLDSVLEGTESVKASLEARRGEGCEVIVVDAVSIEDVEVTAKACVELGWNVLAVDPGPFTAKLAYHRGLIREESPNIPAVSAEPKDKTVLVVAGSATPVTKKQMDVLCKADGRHLRISSEPLPLIEGGPAGREEIDRVASAASALIACDAPPRALLVETALHGELLDLDIEDAKRGYQLGTSADRINAGLGMMVSKILENVGRKRIAGLYTTGGDTMVNVCFQLGVECIEVVDYVIPQTDIGRLVGSYEGMPVVGKGGLTGNDYTACDIVNRLFMESERR